MRRRKHVGRTAPTAPPIAVARPLTERQRRFVEEYLIDGNATQSAIRAGYSRKTAASIGEENLRKPEIARAISEARQARSERTGVTADQVVAELDILRRSSVDDYEFDGSGRLRVRDGVPPEAIRAVASVKHRVKFIPQKKGPPIEVHESEYRLWDKPAACRMLGEHTGIFEHESAKRGAGAVIIEVHGERMGFEQRAPDRPAQRSAGKVPARTRGRGA